MAKIKTPDGGVREVPDEAQVTDRGVEWTEGGNVNVIPWTSIFQFIGPRPVPTIR